MKNSKITYKRGINTIDLRNSLCEITNKRIDYGIVEERVWFVHFEGKCIGHISYCEDLREHTCWPDNESEYMTSGLTLKECKENITRILGVN